ncbi:MAG: VIT1/CCC1 transporter family protein [bacterium]|nr:VIT1/CCC1 transporter family protein [bacterium]
MTKPVTLTSHLRDEHHISPFQTYLKEIVYGGNDGIVTTFAVVAGFTGAQAGANVPTFSILTVLLFGLANLFADGASMGLGNFLSLRAEKDVYRTHEAKELYEVTHHPLEEKAETIAILVGEGFDEKQARQLAKIYETNPNYWTSFMMNYELRIPNPASENPYLTAFATFSAFVVFGIIPLIPYFINQDPTKSFAFSAFATLTALVLLGLLRWKVTTETILRSVLEIVAVGGTSALIAFAVGTFFRL